jgi:hypothetical protein
MRRLRTLGILAATVGLASTAVAIAERTPSKNARVTSWHGFQVGNWPGADWRPYSADSPLNRPIPPNAEVHPRSRQIVAAVLSRGEIGNLHAGNAGGQDDFGHPTYYARSDDPLYRLLPVGGSGQAIAGRRIPIPSAARPAAGADGHMTVVTPDGWEYDFWQVREKPPGGGTLTYSIGGRTRVDGDGLRSAGTASGFGNLAGIIRAQELAARRIDHALFVVVGCASGDRSFGHGARVQHPRDSSFVRPASHGGARCPDGIAAPPIGARFQLAMSAQEIAALRVPAWKKTILTALARYGGYVGDTGGPGFAVQFESSVMYTAFGRPDPLLAFADRNGIPTWGGYRVFNLSDGVDWADRLRVLVPTGR